jgi:hypothetical protein
MPRTAIAVTNVPTPYDVDGETVTLTNADTVNHHDFDATRAELLLVLNTDAAVARTVTIKAVADRFGRAVDSLFAVPALGYRVFNLRALEGWQQTTGKIHVDVDHANLRLAVLRIP